RRAPLSAPFPYTTLFRSERIVLAVGLGSCALALVGAAEAGGFGVLLVLLGLAGAAGASVNAASGRAVMYWFPAAERGLALGVRRSEEHTSELQSRFDLVC